MTSAALAEAPVSSYWCLTAGLDQLLHIGPGGADTFADDGPLDAPSAAGADKAAKQRSKNGLAPQDGRAPFVCSSSTMPPLNYTCAMLLHLIRASRLSLVADIAYISCPSSAPASEASAARAILPAQAHIQG